MRPAILFVVLALHLAILALILMASRTWRSGSVEHPIELVFIAPPLKSPRVMIENARPRNLGTSLAVIPAPAMLNSSLQQGSPYPTDGHGSAVNWAAEARRAVRAFEIRENQPTNSYQSVSSSLGEQDPLGHHAGDQLKTANGDWIVWINANCYQIASWRPGVTALGAFSPQTICRNPDEASHNN
jgi:hypothetical protein